MRVIHYKKKHQIMKQIRSCHMNSHRYRYLYTIEDDVILHICFTCNKVKTNISEGEINERKS